MTTGAQPAGSLLCWCGRSRECSRRAAACRPDTAAARRGSASAPCPIHAAWQQGGSSMLLELMRLAHEAAGGLPAGGRGARGEPGRRSLPLPNNSRAAALSMQPLLQAKEQAAREQVGRHGSNCAPLDPLTRWGAGAGRAAGRLWALQGRLGQPPALPVHCRSCWSGCAGHNSQQQTQS